jgi:peptide chain release factor subunit 1
MSDKDKDAKAEERIEMWKVKQLIKKLSAARGNGTSMISLIIPPKGQISLTQQMLQGEYGTASNIKSRVNRLSVLSAIVSTQQRLKLYSNVPPNGLVMYCGTVITDTGKERKVNIDFEPYKPINTSLYLCDNKFHTEDLGVLLEDSDRFGFVVMDGNGCLFGTLCGNHRTILHKFSVDLPKKHGRGGQSALRFARLRLEKRRNYVRKVAELTTQMFIESDLPNVKGIVLAGSASFKVDLFNSALFDGRLKKIVIKTVDVSYGGENGFNQAIELSAEALSNVKYIEETKLIASYFDHIARDTGKYCFGIKDTMTALEMSAVETLIVWENLDMERLELRNTTTNETTVKFLKPGQLKDTSNFHDEKTGTELVIEDRKELVEWFAENYKTWGAKIEFITDRSQEGSQFCKGFGGVGGILRWAVNFVELAGYEENDDIYGSDDDEYDDDSDDYDY